MRLFLLHKKMVPDLLGTVPYNSWKKGTAYNTSIRFCSVLYLKTVGKGKGHPYEHETLEEVGGEGHHEHVGDHEPHLLRAHTTSETSDPRSKNIASSRNDRVPQKHIMGSPWEFGTGMAIVLEVRLTNHQSRNVTFRWQKIITCCRYSVVFMCMYEA